MTWGQREKIQGMNFQFSMESFQINENKKRTTFEKNNLAVKLSSKSHIKI